MSTLIAVPAVNQQYKDHWHCWSSLSCSACQQLWTQDQTCQHLVNFIKDRPLIPRTEATLPKEFYIGDSAVGCGIFCQVPVEANVVLGPLEAPGRDESSADGEGWTQKHWMIFSADSAPQVLVTGDEYRCNWLSLVRPAEGTTGEQANLMAFQYKDEIYLITTRAIGKDEELCYDHSPAYSMLRGIYLNDINASKCGPVSSVYQVTENAALTLQTHQETHIIQATSDVQILGKTSHEQVSVLDEIMNSGNQNQSIGNVEKSEDETDMERRNIVEEISRIVEVGDSTETEIRKEESETQKRVDNLIFELEYRTENGNVDRCLRSAGNEKGLAGDESELRAKIGDGKDCISVCDIEITKTEDLVVRSSKLHEKMGAISVKKDCDVQIARNSSAIDVQTQTEVLDSVVFSPSRSSGRKRSKKLPEDTTSPSKRPRRGKNVDCDSNAVIKEEKSDEGVETVKKRRPGRPRKVVQVEDDLVKVIGTVDGKLDVVNQDGGLGDSLKVRIKRRRGRGGDPEQSENCAEDSSVRIETENENCEIHVDSEGVKNDDVAEKEPEVTVLEHYKIAVDVPTLEPLDINQLEELELEQGEEILKEVEKVLPRKVGKLGRRKKGKKKMKVEDDSSSCDMDETVVIKEEHDFEFIKEEDMDKIEDQKKLLKEQRLHRMIGLQAEKTLRLSILYCTEDDPSSTLDMDTVQKAENKIWFIPHEKLKISESEILLPIGGGKLFDIKPNIAPVEILSQLYNSEKYSLAVSHPERWGTWVNSKVIHDALDTVESGMGICNICGWKNSRPNEVKFHLIRQHTAIKDYLCDLCGAKFTDWRQLWRHKYNHVPNESRRKYYCKTCGKCFDRQGKLTRHMHIHEDNHLKQMCEMCGKAFRCQNHLKRHKLAVHSNLRPHHCPVCGRGYKEKRDLKRHVLVVHNITENGIQQKEDGTYNVLDSQTKIFKTFQCMFCSLSCRDRKDFRAHLKKIHPMQASEITEKEILGAVRYSDIQAQVLPLFPGADHIGEKTDAATGLRPILPALGGITEVSASTILASPQPLYSTPFPKSSAISVLPHHPQTSLFAPSSQAGSSVAMTTAETGVGLSTFSPGTLLLGGGGSATQQSRSHSTASAASGQMGGMPVMQYQTLQVLPEGAIAIPCDYQIDVQQLSTVAYSLQ